MAFKLPKYTELTNDQKIIAGLGFDKNILVSAAPGTGKTVIAIYRAHELSDAGKKVAMLVYKRTLMKYLESTVKSLKIRAVVNTWHSWLVEFYDKTLDKKNGYRLDSDDAYSYNWSRIKMDFERWGARNTSKMFDTVILDEAQDIPIDLIGRPRIMRAPAHPDIIIWRAASIISLITSMRISLCPIPRRS